MIAVRLLALGCSSLLAGCFFMSVSVPDVPSTERPNLPEDKFLDLDARTERVKVNYEVQTGRSCVGSTCAKSYENRSKNVNVRVASGSIDGRPVSLRELAVMASPEFVADTDKVSGYFSACRRGRISMAVGATAAIVGLMLLQRGFDEDMPSRDMAIGGYASLGVAAVGIIGGYTVFGGQHCGKAGEIYKRWKTIYRDPDDVKVTGEAAAMYEQLADKFNRDRQDRVAPPPTTTEEPVQEAE